MSLPNKFLWNKMCSVFLEWQRRFPGKLEELEELSKFVITIEKQQLKICMKRMVGFHTICMKESILKDSRIS